MSVVRGERGQRGAYPNVEGANISNGPIRVNSRGLQAYVSMHELMQQMGSLKTR
jgi:hypothetical protein